MFGNRAYALERMRFDSRPLEAALGGGPRKGVQRSGKSE